MELNKLYFLKDEFFERFPDEDLSINKTTDIEELHDRPCFYSFKDKDNDIYWMIPISSKYEKYEAIYEKAIERYGFCDTISLGYVKGNKNAFLIQNMVPTTINYINNLYVSGQNGNPIEINDSMKKEINAKARKVLRLTRNGKKLTFSNILEIESVLLKDLKTNKMEENIEPV